MRTPILLACGLVGLTFAAACKEPAPRPGVAATSDTAFASMQDRGQQAMKVEQYGATHVFEDLPDGGRIVLDRDDASDRASRDSIRAHMREIATAFAAGRFDAPALVHAQEVPGTGVMRERRRYITYGAVDRPRGAEVRIVTRDKEAVVAIHQFLAFQRGEHRAAGHDQRDHEGGRSP